MSATSRLKQLLFIIAGLALVVVGLTSLTTAAQADDTGGGEPCVETQDGFTEFIQTDTIVQHGDATPPGTNTELKEFRGPTETPHITKEGTEGTPAQDTRVWWVFRGQNGDAAPAANSDLWKAQPNLPAGQSQHSYPGENGLGVPYQPGANAGSGDWFRFTGTLIPEVPGTPEESHTDYTWTVWEREFVEGVDCPPEECPEESDVEHDALEGEHADDECDEDDDDENCPKGTDNAGQNIDEVESCDEDPIIGPGEGENPGNNPGNNPGTNPSNNPGNSPSANPQGSNLPNNAVTPVSAPGADVPSAVNAGLLPAQDELTGSGNGLGLIGMGTVLIGLGLLGLTLSPRRGRRLAG